jgi:asparagine synthase (glutamine-hydrolysing)
MKISLSKLNWYTGNNIRVTGFIRSGDRYLIKEELLNYFTGINSPEEFRQKLVSANGNFSLIIESAGEIWAATDRLRNYPLFYTFHEGEFILSDDCYTLAGLLSNKKFNPVAVESFFLTGYTINNLTLLKDIFQVEAGQFIRIGEAVTTGFYDKLFSKAIINKDFEVAGEELSQLLNDVFCDHLKALKNRFIAVPLSGGYDSRLVAAMCSKYHPENLICFTYGIRNNPEETLAGEVVKRLGFKWVNIVYDSALIKGYMQDNFFNDYYPYVANLSSMFFMQEYFAVKYLKENRLIPDDTVFIPGSSGDMLAGSHLHPAMERKHDKDQIAGMLFNDHFVLVGTDKKRKQELLKLLSEKIPSGIYDTWRITEAWDTKERQAKFVINSAKVYSFFGYDYVLPFWDNMLIGFFSELPFKMKLYKKLYDHVLSENIFKQLDLNLKNEINPMPAAIAFQRLKERVKKLLPSGIKNLFIREESPVFYDEITKVMLNEIGMERVITPRQSSYYNSYIIQWYLLKTKKFLEIEDE